MMQYRKIVWFAAVMSVVFMLPQNEVYAENGRCQTQECLRNKAKLEELGYDSLVAERIVLYRPDLSYLITHPDVPVHPGGFQDSISNENRYDKWFSDEFFVQDRKPITVYRGLTLHDGERFDPTYFLKGDLPITDARIFTSDKPVVALGYANFPGKQGLLLKMQVPRFMVSEVKPGPYGLVYFRDLVPNDLIFVNGATSVSYRPLEERGDQLASIRFEPLREDDHRIVPTPLTRDELIGKDGRFVSTKSWVNLVCRIRNHPAFAKLNSKITDESKKEEFVAIFNPLEDELEKDALIQEKRKIDQARLTLGSIPLPELQNARTEEEINEIMVQFVAQEAEHCLNSKEIWIEAQIEKERKKVEAEFLSTHKAIHLGGKDTIESRIIKRIIESIVWQPQPLAIPLMIE